MSKWDERAKELQRIRRTERKANPRPGDAEAERARNSRRWREKRKHDTEYRANRVEGLNQRRKTRGPDTWRKIGATWEDFDEFWELQLGKCGICKKELNRPGTDRSVKDKAHLDHCHETGKLRGLLCYPCNTKLSFVEKYYNEICDYLEYD